MFHWKLSIASIDDDHWLSVGRNLIFYVPCMFYSTCNLISSVPLPIDNPILQVELETAHCFLDIMQTSFYLAEVQYSAYTENNVKITIV